MAMFFTFYNISQPNFANLLSLGIRMPFQAVVIFCLFRIFSEFRLKGERSIIWWNYVLKILNRRDVKLFKSNSFSHQADIEILGKTLKKTF